MSCPHLESLESASSHFRSPNPIVFPWFGIRTKSNHEKLASSVLASKGYDSYLPSYTERRCWTDRTVLTRRPLFPGYLFCRFDPANRMPVLAVPGVVSVLGYGNQPVAIPDREIEDVEAVLRSGLAASPCSFLHKGQRIRVTRGPLEGLEGILVRQKNGWRLVVSVYMLQRSISVEIDSDLVTAI